MPARSPAQTRNRRIVLAAGAGVAQRAVQLVATLVTLPLVLHSLGIAGFGIWGAATSLAWLSGMLDLGLGSALVTLLPRSLAAGEGERSRAYVTASLFGGGALTVLVLAGGLLCVAAGAAHVPSAPFLAAGIAIALNIPLSIAAEIWLGLQKGYMAASWQLLQTLLTLAFLVIAADLAAGLTAMVAAVYAAMLIANAASLLHVLITHPKLHPHRRVSAQALQTVLSQGGMMFAITIAGACAYVFDNLMALAWLGPDASAQMTIALRVCTTATGMLGVMTQPFWPGFADAVILGDNLWLRRSLFIGTLGIIGLSVTGSSLLILCGAPVLHWWLHENLHITQALLCAMAAWITLTTLPHMPGLLLHAALRLRPQVIIFTFAAIAGFIMKYVAARPFGVVGILSVYPFLWLFFVTPAYFWLAGQLLTAPDRKTATGAIKA